MRFNPTFSPARSPGPTPMCPPGYTMINKNMQGYTCVSTSAVPKPARCPAGYSMTKLGHGKFVCTRTVSAAVKMNPMMAAFQRPPLRAGAGDCPAGMVSEYTPHKGYQCVPMKAKNPNGGACCGECAEHAASNPCGGASANPCGGVRMNPAFTASMSAPRAKCKPGYAWNAKTKKCEFQKIVLQPSGDPLGNPVDVHSFLVRAWSQPRRVTAGPMMAPCAPGQFYAEDLGGCYWPAGSVKKAPKSCPPGQTWTEDLGCQTIPGRPVPKFPTFPRAPMCPPGMTWTQDLGCVVIPTRR